MKSNSSETLGTQLRFCAAPKPRPGEMAGKISSTHEILENEEEWDDSYTRGEAATEETHIITGRSRRASAAHKEHVKTQPIHPFNHSFFSGLPQQRSKL